MTLELTNFLAWFVQVLVVISLGAALPFAFGLKAPKLRLTFWYVLLASCMALPLMQPWRALPMADGSGVTINMSAVQAMKEVRDSAHVWSAIEITGAVLGAGAMLRFLWLAAGFLRLRRYRRNAQQLLPLPEEARRTIQRLGVHADLFVSEDVTSPVTFGLFNPAILVPAEFLELPPEKREPVILHELLHVQRNDWLFAIGEELVRCILWFHPAVWWLLGRIQLTREQVVDHAVIEHTNAPEEYVDALIAIAATRLEADLAPAPLFLKKRHLRERVASIVKGVNMSKRSLLMSTIAVFSALPLVVGIAAWQFPLNAAPQEVQDGKGIEVRTGGYKLLHRGAVSYPAAARAKNVSGEVVVSVALDAKGEVADARVVSGPEELRKSALASVLNWHFAVDQAVTAPFEVSIRYYAAQAPSAPDPDAALRTPLPPTARFYPVDRIDVSEVPAAMRDRVSSVLNASIHEGDTLTREKFTELWKTLKGVDEHLGLRGAIHDDKVTVRAFLMPNPGTGTNSFAGSAYSFTGPSAAATSEKAASATNVPGRIRVGGNVQAVNLIQKVTPAYPPVAKQAGVQGTVRMNATIDREGRVIDLELVSGHPLLVPSAMDAVKQWVYKPTLLNGNPVEVITQIDVNYTLTQ